MTLQTRYESTISAIVTPAGPDGMRRAACPRAELSSSAADATDSRPSTTAIVTNAVIRVTAHRPEAVAGVGAQADGSAGEERHAERLAEGVREERREQREPCGDAPGPAGGRRPEREDLDAAEQQKAPRREPSASAI